MTTRNLYGFLIGIGFCIALAAEARGNEAASGLALMAMGITMLVRRRSA